MHADFDHIVVGAGMSGLAYARFAQRRGARVLVLEAGNRAGGVIETQTTDGYRHEWAATSVPSSSEHLLSLLEDGASSDLWIEAAAAGRAQFLLGPRGLVAVPRGPKALLTSPLLSGRAKLRALTELVRGRQPGTNHETLRDFVARRFGDGIAEAFLRPFTSGIYGAAPERLGAADAFPALVAMERRRGGILRGLAAKRPRRRRSVLMPRDGMGSIVGRIAADLGTALRLESSVARIEPGSVDSPAVVHTVSGETYRGAEVSLALRAPAQAALLQDSHAAAAETLGAVAYVPMVVVAVGFRREDAPAIPAGFGFLRGSGSAARILGATFNSQLNPDTAPEGCELLTAFLGGSEDPTALALDDEAVRTTVLGDLAAALGGAVRPAMMHITRHAQAIPLFAPGHRGRMAATNAAVADARFRLLGSHVTGVSLNDCCRPAAPLATPLPTGLTRL